MEVTGADRAVNGGHIGKVVAKFNDATPTITADEVRDFAANWRHAFPWAKADEHPHLTIGIVEKHMATFRVWRRSQPPPLSDRERQRQELNDLVKKEAMTREDAERDFGGSLDA